MSVVARRGVTPRAVYLPQRGQMAISAVAPPWASCASRFVAPKGLDNTKMIRQAMFAARRDVMPTAAKVVVAADVLSKIVCIVRTGGEGMRSFVQRLILDATCAIYFIMFVLMAAGPSSR